MLNVTNPAPSDTQHDAAPIVMPSADIVKLPANKRAWALEMARRNFAVFPLVEDDKIPLPGSDGHKGATTDPDLIRELWTDPMTGAIRNYNIGVCPSNGRVVIIDLDVKEGRDGINAYLALGGEIAGMVVRTTTGGLHIFCLGDDLRTGAGRLAPGIDTRTADGYVVGPGSTIDGVAYELILDEPMRPVPQFVIDRIGTRADRAARMVTTTRIESDKPQNIARAIDIAKKAEPAVSGCWHDLGYPLGCEMCRVGLSPEMAVEVLLEHWVPRGEGFKSQAQFERDVLGGYQDAMPQHGIHSVDAQCEAFKGLVVVPPPDEPAPLPPPARAAEGIKKANPPPPELPTTTLQIATAAFPKWRRVSSSSLAGKQVPPREWLVDQWLAPGHVTLLYGEGGTGKSVLMQQLMLACATGKEWLGQKVAQCSTFGLFCEDDEDELHRRQVALCSLLNVAIGDTDDMAWVSGADTENELIVFDRAGRAESTVQFNRLLEEVKDTRARLVGIDTGACTFGGDENVRRQVTAFLRVCLGAVARSTNAAVLLSLHPSRAGVNKGDPDGGSTGWGGSARARWTLAKPQGELGQVDPDERVLRLPKSNYGRDGLELRVRRTNEGFIPVVPLSVDETRQRWEVAENTFLALLDKSVGQGRDLSPSRNSSTNYAPKVFAAMPREERRHLLAGDFEQAMERLFNMGKICEVAAGTAARPRRIIMRA